MGLHPGQAPVHQPSHDDQIAGGKSLSPRKILANAMRHRKWCNADCPFFAKCPLLPLAWSETQRKPNDARDYHPCKLRDAPDPVKRRINNMFLGGEEGLLDEIRGTLFVTSTHLGDDNRERLQYADSLMRFHKACYGEKSQLTASPEPLEITVVQLNKDGSQGIKISKPERDDVIRQANAAALLAAVKPISLEDPDDSVNDPESLFNSPILDTYIKRDNETQDRTAQQTD